MPGWDLCFSPCVIGLWQPGEPNSLGREHWPSCHCPQCHQRHSLLEENIRGSAGDTGTSPTSQHRAFPDILRRTSCSLQETTGGKAWPCWVGQSDLPLSVLAATTLQELRRSDPAIPDMGHATRSRVPAPWSCCQCPTRQPQLCCSCTQGSISHPWCLQEQTWFGVLVFFFFWTILILLFFVSFRFKQNKKVKFPT